MKLIKHWCVNRCSRSPFLLRLSQQGNECTTAGDSFHYYSKPFPSPKLEGGGGSKNGFLSCNSVSELHIIVCVSHGYEVTDFHEAPCEDHSTGVLPYFCSF